MRDRKQLLAISLLAVLSSASFSGCSQQARVTKHPGHGPVKVTLEAVIENHWDENLLDIPSLFPGGTITRTDAKLKVDAYYVVAARFTDISADGMLWLYQSETDIEDRANAHIRTKRIALRNQSSDEQDAIFDEICTFIKGLHPHVFTTTNPLRCDAEFSIDAMSRNKHPLISITKDRPSTNTLDLHIQQVKSRKSHLTTQSRETSR